MYENLGVAELVFTKQKLKYAYLSLHLSEGQHSTILKCILKSCNMIGRELRFHAELYFLCEFLLKCALSAT